LRLLFFNNINLVGVINSGFWDQELTVNKMFFLNRIKIKHYKLLHDFELVFEKHEPLTVLLGINGSGKSTVLECLVWIFRAMHEKYFYNEELQVPFDFELDYETGNSIVTVLPEKTWHEVMLQSYHVTGRTIREDNYELITTSPIGFTQGEGTIWEQPDPEEMRTAVPNLVVYYSGLSENLYDIYKWYEIQYLEKSWGKAAAKDTAFASATALPFYYLKKDDLGLLLAGLYAYEFNIDLDNFFLKTLNVKKPDEGSILLIVRRPEYERTLVAKGKRVKPSRENFWNTEGVLLQFLMQIQATASGTRDIGDSTIAYSFSQAKWYELRQAYGTERDLLALLLLLRANEMLGKIHVMFERDGLTTNYSNLSEGEQQLLTVRALSELLIKDPTLLIFDEPNAYQHPSWQRQLPSFLAPLLEYASCVMTTHSPILLTHLRKGTLVTMEKGMPRKLPGTPYGQRYADTLSDYMGLGTRPPEQEAAVNRVLALLEAEDVDLTTAEAALEELRQMDGVGVNDPDVLRAEAMLAFWKH
jgi:energy-coupling factor transporter ATP-binding protein EcfA2